MVCRFVQHRIVLHSSKYTKDHIVGEHDLKQGRLVEQKYAPEDAVQSMQRVHVLAILARVEQVREFTDVSVGFYRDRQPFTFDRRSEACDKERGDLIEVG